MGDYEVLEHVTASAPTIRAAIDTAFRQARIVNDAAALRLEVHGKKAYAILHSIVPLQRASADFRTAAFYVAVANWLKQMPNELEVWFTHDVPADDMEYRNTFGDTKIVWSAPLDGYVFDAEWLDTPLPSADANLPTLLRKHADQTMGKLPPANSLVPADHRAEHRRHCIRAGLQRIRGVRARVQALAADHTRRISLPTPRVIRFRNARVSKMERGRPVWVRLTRRDRANPATVRMFPAWHVT